VLLGAITALVVARPLVLGEDPGLSATRWSDPSNLWLTLGWFLTAAGWASGRVWSRQTAWYVGLAEAGFLVVVGLVFGSAFWAAAYKHPAYLIAWEWLALLTAFFLVRQLVRNLEDSKRLLAVLLASGVSLSAYAAYQYTVELPAMRVRFAPNTEEARLMPTIFLQRIQQNNAFATFAHPNAFAGYLALLLPGALGAGFVCYRRLRWSWKTWLVFGCFSLTAVGLWLTHSRGAILGSLLVGAGVLLARAPGRARRFILPVLVVGLIALGLVLWLSSWGQRGLELAGQSMAKRLGYWKATWAMITDSHYPRHCWLGVGPGNFGRYYPRYMDPTVGEKVTDPHNFALELWSTCGLFSLLALLATLALFFWWTRTAWTGADARPEEIVDQPPAPVARVDTRWEFYLGGSIGLLFGFLISGLMESDASQVADLDLLSKLLFWLAHDRDKLIRVTLCSLLWFPTFGLLEIVPWNRTALRLVLVAGVTGLLLNLTVSGGISYPSVALPLWVFAALALNTLPDQPLPWGSRSWLAQVLPLPVAVTLCVAFFMLIFYPVTTCFSLLKMVYRFEIGWVAQWDPEWLQLQLQIVNEREEKKRQDLQKKRADITRRNMNAIKPFARPTSREDSEQTPMGVLATLQEAHEQDPNDVLPCLELAYWNGEYWKLVLFQGAQARPPLKIREDAVRWAAKAQEIDPESLEGYLTLYRLNLLFAQFAEKQTQSFYNLAARALAQAVKRDPTEARLHFQLADAWFKADNPVEGRAAAREAQRLDALSTEPTRQLSNAQREQIKNWLNPAAPTPPLGSDAPIR
jgi:hypothetical protein